MSAPDAKKTKPAGAKCLLITLGIALGGPGGSVKACVKALAAGSTLSGEEVRVNHSFALK